MRELAKTFSFRKNKNSSHRVTSVVNYTWFAKNISNQLFRNYRFIWIILTLTSAIAAIIYMNETVKGFLEFNVVTEVRLVDVDELDFPTVTICDKNKFATDESMKQLRKLLDEHYSNNNKTLEEITKIAKNENKDLLNFARALNFFPCQEIRKDLTLDQGNEGDSFGKHDVEIFGKVIEKCSTKSMDFEWIFQQ